MTEISDELIDEPTHNPTLNNNNNELVSSQTKRTKKLCQQMENKRLYKRLMLLLTKPSYTLAIGSKNARHENRNRLRHLLLKLVRQHSWTDASGVLSVLLKGTCKETSVSNIRLKYSIAMELLRQMENDKQAYSRKIQRLHEEIWWVKINSYRNRPLKDRHVQLELIHSFVAQDNPESAKQIAIGLQKQRESESDPKSNLVIGLTFYELWYSGLKHRIQDERDLDVTCISSGSDTIGNNNCDLVEDMNGEDAGSFYQTFSYSHALSETSVLNDKKSNGKVNLRPNGEISKANIIPPVEHQRKPRPQGFYMNSAETGTEDGPSSQGHNNMMHSSYSLNVHGLQSLLPLRLASLDILSSYRGYFEVEYKLALKYLQLALKSPPPVSEAALLPLIQLLLLGDRVDETLDVVEKSCNESNSVFPFRLRARLWECFDANNDDKLSACFEDVLKKDPACRHSMARLLRLHMKGDYAPVRLVEMIALHLEATSADSNIWREFASCLLKLSHCEEDRGSVCESRDQVEYEHIHTVPTRRIPLMFVEEMSRKTWKLRCRWWLKRHFSKDMLTSDLASGDLQLMTYKAACASHLYGKEMEYVVKVHDNVKEHDRTMIKFLNMHIQNSIGFFSNLVKK